MSSADVDRWGEPVAARSAGSVVAWDAAWADASHFVGDPFARLEAANKTDHSFAMGSIFCGTYRVLGGAPLDSPEVRADHHRASIRAADEREAGHLKALEYLVAGNFTQAGRTWDAVADGTHDYAAVRFAHDVYLHVGDAARRLRSSERAFEQWDREHPGWSFVAGQLSFAMEEVGLYADAEELAKEALATDSLDLWALHSLAHLYETLDDSDAAIGLLRAREPVWSEQDGLAVHIWWHLALRLIAVGDYTEALAIHDEQLPVATTPFRLCDLASLLWRLEFKGVDVGDRWDGLADRFANRPEWHTSGFLDLHAAFIFTRRPQHAAAQRFFDGVASSHAAAASENDGIFLNVVQPLVGAIRSASNDPHTAVASLDGLAGNLHRIGGSIAQRDVVGLTRDYLTTN